MGTVYTYLSSASPRIITLCFINRPGQSQLNQASLRYEFIKSDESDVTQSKVTYPPSKLPYNVKVSDVEI